MNVPSEQTAFVRQLLAMLGLKEESSETVEKVSPELRAELEETIRQVREGKTMSMEEFKARTASWFK